MKLNAAKAANIPLILETRINQKHVCIHSLDQSKLRRNRLAVPNITDVLLSIQGYYSTIFNDLSELLGEDRFYATMIAKTC